MLPPLGAVSGASVDYQTVARPALATPAAQGVVGGRSSTALPTDLLSGGRIDVLSLSGQVQLAQGLSVFTEAVGGYLKITRREGESLVDYAQRLVDALKSLTPSQRAGLEQSLAQLSREITLQMLTEILADPSGADAARLTAYLVTVPAAGRDPAARAVVSSYRQNGATDAIATSPTRAPAGPSTTPGAAELGMADRTGGSLSTTAAGTTAAAGGRSPALPAPAQSPMAQAAGTASAPATILADAGGNAAALGAPGRELRPDGPAPTQGSTRPSTQPGTLSPSEPGEDLAKTPSKAIDPAMRETAKPDVTTATEPRGASAGTAVGITAGGVAVIYDAAALVRMAQKLPDEAGSKFLQAVFYRAAPATGPVGAEPPLMAEDGPGSPAATLLAAQPDETLPTGPRMDAMRTAAPLDGGLQATRTSLSGASADPLPLPAAATGETGARPQGAQPAFEAAAFVAAAPMVAREGLVQPFVAYPQVQPPPQEDERDVERVSAIDEDGGDRPSQQDAQGKDQGSEGDNPSEGADTDEADGNDDTRVDRAEDLYWRMADLT